MSSSRHLSDAKVDDRIVILSHGREESDLEEVALVDMENSLDRHSFPWTEMVMGLWLGFFQTLQGHNKN